MSVGGMGGLGNGDGRLRLVHGYGRVLHRRHLGLVGEAARGGVEVVVQRGRQRGVWSEGWRTGGWPLCPSQSQVSGETPVLLPELCDVVVRAGL